MKKIIGFTGLGLIVGFMGGAAVVSVGAQEYFKSISPLMIDTVRRLTSVITDPMITDDEVRSKKIDDELLFFRTSVESFTPRAMIELKKEKLRSQESKE